MQRSTGVGMKEVRQEMNLCMQQPLVSQSMPRQLRAALAHWLRLATVHDFSSFDMLDSTYIGFSDSVSILSVYSICTACEKKSLQALVALQVEMKGTAFYPATEDTLMIALLFSLSSICGTSQQLMKVIGRMLTLISFHSRCYGIQWKQPMFEMPTLLTRIDTSRPYKWLIMRLKKPSFALSAKSATMYFTFTSFYSFRKRSLYRAAYIFVLLRAIMHMLKPNSASYQQKPRPSPSLPPVTTAHESRPYLSMKFLEGRMRTMRAQMILLIQMMKTMPPMTARKQMKLVVELSIQRYNTNQQPQSLMTTDHFLPLVRLLPVTPSISQGVLMTYMTQLAPYGMSRLITLLSFSIPLKMAWSPLQRALSTSLLSTAFAPFLSSIVMWGNSFEQSTFPKLYFFMQPAIKQPGTYTMKSTAIGILMPSFQSFSMCLS